MADHTIDSQLSSSTFVTAVASSSIVYRFAVNTIAYRKDKAKKGILEKIAIKRVRLVGDYGRYIVMYDDTYNAIYGESDLLTQSEAATAALAYYDWKNEQILEAQSV